jgi:hypothetical protein
MLTPTTKTPAKLTVDFSGVEDRRGGVSGDHVPEGDYLLKIVSCERKVKKDSNPKSYYLNWLLEVVQPIKYKGKHVYHSTSLKPEALWSLRNFLVDLIGEKNVPKSSVDVPLATIVKRQLEIGATLADDEYQPTDGGKAKLKSKVAGTYPKKDYADAASGADEEAEEAESDEEESDEDDELEIDDDEL